MLHLRVISPTERTAEAIALLDRATGVTNLITLPGAAHRPEGDVLLFDVAREAANDVIADLRAIDMCSAGSIAIENVDLSLSDAADQAEKEAPGDADDAVVWEELAERVHEDSRMTWAYLTFLAIATQIAAIGVINNSPILIIGAMVLGPEFGPVAAICFGLLRSRTPLILRAGRTLVIGFAVAIAITYVCALVFRGLGWIDSGILTQNDEVQFIVKPDKWSIIIAGLAGAAGVLSITAEKSSALVGVFISVTTVPSAGYAAVAMALTEWHEVAFSALQLGVNIGGMIVAGTLTLIVQRFLWQRYGVRVPSRTRNRR